MLWLVFNDCHYQFLTIMAFTSAIYKQQGSTFVKKYTSPACWLATSPAWSWTSPEQSVTKTGFDRYIDVYDVYWCLSNLSIHMRWRNRFVNVWVLTRSRSVSLKRNFHCFCMFWPRNFTKFIHELIKFHIWNNRLFQMPFERVESVSPQPNAWVFAYCKTGNVCV